MTQAKRMLDLGARLALRAAGHVEPNPLVGAVIVRDGSILGMGHHRRFGGPHAEVEALADCARRGQDPAGATMYVTLEPCSHTGKTPPCTDAIIRASLGRVVIARRDPNPVSADGAAVLTNAGIGVEFTDDSPLARSISDPFVKRVTTGLPWVIAKWAQTIDGRLATRTGESKWISGETSRHRVHRLRARVDAILTAIGTVRADDPRLTARGVRLRRSARRIVIDRDLGLSIDSALVKAARQAPVLVCCRQSILPEHRERVEDLAAAGVEVMAVPGVSGTDALDLRHLLAQLAAERGVCNVLVEGGPGLLGSLFAQDLIDEAQVYIAPMLLGDDRAVPVAHVGAAERLSDAKRFVLCRSHRSGEDLAVEYRRTRVSAADER